jgi:hypothetical protein
MINAARRCRIVFFHGKEKRKRAKKTVDTVFFALRALCRAAAQSSANRIGETLAGFLLALPL